jgi:hypothetical protein
MHPSSVVSGTSMTYCIGSVTPTLFWLRLHCVGWAPRGLHTVRGPEQVCCRHSLFYVSCQKGYKQAAWVAGPKFGPAYCKCVSLSSTPSHATPLHVLHCSPDSIRCPVQNEASRCGGATETTCRLSNMCRWTRGCNIDWHIPTMSAVLQTHRTQIGRCVYVGRSQLPATDADTAAAFAQ